MAKLVIHKKNHRHPLNTTEASLKRTFRKFESEDAKEYVRQKEISQELNQQVRQIFHLNNKFLISHIKLITKLFKDYFSKKDFYYYDLLIQVQNYSTLYTHALVEHTNHR